MEEIIKANRPAISESSIRTYKSILTNLGKQLGFKMETPADAIAHYKEIISHVAPLTANNMKTRLSSLIVFIENAEHASEALEAFRKAMTKAWKQANEDEDDQKMTEKQKEAMIQWDEVLAHYNELEKKVKPLFKKEELTKEDFAQLQMFILLSCVVLIEPRRSMDWTEFKLRNIDADNDNYLKVEKRKPYLVFNKFKTVGHMGAQTIPCPPALHKLLKMWSEKNKNDWLLMNVSQTNKINSTQYGKLLYEFFGKKVSTNILRHSYLIKKYHQLPALKEMKQTANNMAHNVEQAMRYVVKEK